MYYFQTYWLELYTQRKNMEVSFGGDSLVCYFS